MPTVFEAPTAEVTLSVHGLASRALCWGPQHGPAVVLCHGWLDLAWSWLGVASALSRAGLRVVAFDWRGHGQSGRNALSQGSYYFPEYVRDVGAVIAGLGIKAYHLVGHSMGGTAAAWYASLAPSGLRSVTLVEGLGPEAESTERSDARLRDWLAELARSGGNTVARVPSERVAHRLFLQRFAVSQGDAALGPFLAQRYVCHGAEGWRWHFDDRLRWRGPIAFDEQRFVRALACIDVPVLVCQGGESRLARVQAPRLARLSRAKYHCVQGSGHMVLWSHAQYLAEVMLDFFEENEIRE